MKSRDSYRIGPGLRDKLRDMVNAFDGSVVGSGGGDIPVCFQDMGGRGGGGSPARLFEFTGAWSKNSVKSVKMLNGDGTEITPAIMFNVKNYFASISGNCSVRKGAAMRIGSTWVMIAVECV